MGTHRLEAFSDGVLAIIITIMVLELQVPHGTAWRDLLPLGFVFLSYVLSFVYVAIYWNNHHHLLHTVDRVSGGILWANLHLLFWLSLIPFGTAWMGENNFAALPSALYGMVLLMAAVAWWILQKSIIATHGRDSRLARAIGRDLKGYSSVALYSLGILAALYFHGAIAWAIYALVALIWLVPDRRIERVLAAEPKGVA